MNALFVYLASVVMLTRLPLLSVDGPVPGRKVVAASGLQLVAVLLLSLTLAVGFVCLLMCAVNAGWWEWERRLGDRGQLGARLASWAAHMVVIGAACAPVTGLAFRSDLPLLAGQIGFYFLPLLWLQALPWESIMGWLFGALLSLGEANLLVRVLIERLALKPRSSDGEGGPVRGVLVGGEYSRGRVIGMLERLIVFALVSRGEFAALGLVIAAKGLARFKDLQEREFAEYFLVGTMLSMVLAGGIGLLVSMAVR